MFIHPLITVLKRLKKERNNGNNGEDFENKIKNVLTRYSLRHCSFDKEKHDFIGDLFLHLNKTEIEENIKCIKDRVLDKTNIELIENPFISDIYIYTNLLVLKTFQIF